MDANARCFKQPAPSLRSALTLGLLLWARTTTAVDVNIGYDVYAAVQDMMNQASHDWEYGTGAEALLELYNPELSVFGPDPFPNGGIPQASASTAALAYAQQFIQLDAETLMPDTAVGDPASLGVSAILLGQTDNDYIQSAINQANFILNTAPKWSNGAISQRSNVAELWADFMAMAPPFLAYYAAQSNNATLMAYVVTQCGLYRDVLQVSGGTCWQHIIGPDDQDTGLWSTGNGWAAYGMVRVLYTLQAWSGSSDMTGQAGQLQGWIQEILDCAMGSTTGNGLLTNYLDDSNSFGEVSGTALLTAAAYRMAVNDPGTFGQNYISWADGNRQTLAGLQGANGIFAPTVDPYSWTDSTPYTAGSPEGQAFTVYVYTAYRDCVNAGICQPNPPPSSTISSPGIGPIDIMTMLDHVVTFSAMPPPPTCGPPLSCDDGGCAGQFAGLAAYPVCTGNYAGCECTATANTCGAQQSCDNNGCAGAFQGLTANAVCTGNFIGCECLPTNNTCGPHQSCDNNGCAGAFTSLSEYPVCTGNFIGCECTATNNTCGPPLSCDMNGCAGEFDGLVEYPACTGNFIGCECAATNNTCGARQSCDNNGCAGAFTGLTEYPVCTGNFIGCECEATANTCGPSQSCDNNGCAGAFQGLTEYPVCTGNFIGCPCTATNNTCGARQSCDNNGCAGAFTGLTEYPVCTGNFIGCECEATANTCGASQSCDNNGCAGAFTSSTEYPVCTGNFVGCQCTATNNTCGDRQSCDNNGCAGAFTSSTEYPVCTGNFIGCECEATANTCGNPQSCDNNGCAGAFSGLTAYPACTGNFVGCQCQATTNTCGAQQDCGNNGCAGAFDLSNGLAYCAGNFVGCECTANPSTCGTPASCDQDNCAGAFVGEVALPTCTNYFEGCVCEATSNTCGPSQSCDNNGCAGAYDSNGAAYCQGNFQGCGCTATNNTCGTPQDCDLNNCNGAFDSDSDTARCTGSFAGCVCLPVAATCGTEGSCSANGCNGAYNSAGNAVCTGNFYGCPCTPEAGWTSPQQPACIYGTPVANDCMNALNAIGVSPTEYIGTGSNWAYAPEKGIDTYWSPFYSSGTCVIAIAYDYSLGNPLLPPPYESQFQNIADAVYDANGNCNGAGSEQTTANTALSFTVCVMETGYTCYALS